MILNFVILEGHLISDVSYAVTEKNNDECASFMVCIDQVKPVWNKIRVNAFGEQARSCKEKRLALGSRVVVVGEIMTRLGATKVYSNELRLFRVLNVSQEDFVQSIRQTIANALSLDQDKDRD